jgi:hypothetical protein
MTLLTKNFTSSQCINHTAAAFGVAYANSFESKQQTYIRGNPNYSDVVLTGNGDININVQYYYWADQDAYDTGLDPFILINRVKDSEGVLKHVGMSFDFNAKDPIYDGMTLEQICLHYLENVILA